MYQEVICVRQNVLFCSRLALCKMLAFWTDCNSIGIDRLFRQSGLYRAKWDKTHTAEGSTYGQVTIRKAIEATTKTYGPDGKTTFLQTINAMLGDYAKQTPTETLVVKKKGAIPNDVARLKGVRFVTASEAEAYDRLTENLIKQMTGSDTVSARFLHQEWFDFEPNYKIFLATNHRPVIQGTDPAIWRRIKLIPFDVTIPEPERNRHLLKKLKEELPGIMAWAVRGCLEWIENG